MRRVLGRGKAGGAAGKHRHTGVVGMQTSQRGPWHGQYRGREPAVDRPGRAAWATDPLWKWEPSKGISHLCGNSHRSLQQTPACTRYAHVSISCWGPVGPTPRSLPGLGTAAPCRVSSLHGPTAASARDRRAECERRKDMPTLDCVCRERGKTRSPSSLPVAGLPRDAVWEGGPSAAGRRGSGPGLS